MRVFHTVYSTPSLSGGSRNEFCSQVLGKKILSWSNQQKFEKDKKKEVALKSILFGQLENAASINYFDADVVDCKVGS